MKLGSNWEEGVMIKMTGDYPSDGMTGDLDDGWEAVVHTPAVVPNGMYGMLGSQLTPAKDHWYSPSELARQAVVWRQEIQRLTAENTKLRAQNDQLQAANHQPRISITQIDSSGPAAFTTVVQELHDEQETKALDQVPKRQRT